MDSRAPVSRAPGNPGHFPFPNSRECKRLDSQRNREQLTAVAGPADQHYARAIQQVTAHSRRMGRQRASALRRPAKTTTRRPPPLSTCSWSLLVLAVSL